jgi:hypothetical protein
VVRKRTQLVWRGPGGEPIVMVSALALIVGVTVDEVRSVLGDVGTADFMSLPDEWIWAARLRAIEAQAATGDNNLSIALLYFAQKNGDDAEMNPRRHAVVGDR